jgi:hypothetical protein
MSCVLCRRFVQLVISVDQLLSKTIEMKVPLSCNTYRVCALSQQRESRLLIFSFAAETIVFFLKSFFGISERYLSVLSTP